MWLQRPDRLRPAQARPSPCASAPAKNHDNHRPRMRAPSGRTGRKRHRPGHPRACQSFSIWTSSSRIRIETGEVLPCRPDDRMRPSVMPDAEAPVAHIRALLPLYRANLQPGQQPHLLEPRMVDTFQETRAPFRALRGRHGQGDA
jgi:hypothetical protein